MRAHRHSRSVSVPCTSDHSRRAVPWGFTLVEAVVASVIFVIGVLGMQAAATVVVRQARDARTQALSAEVAAARFEQFAHVSCAGTVSGAERVRGVHSEWQTSAMPAAGAVFSSQAIRFVRGTTERTDSYHGAFRCR